MREHVERRVFFDRDEQAHPHHGEHGERQAGGDDTQVGGARHARGAAVDHVGRMPEVEAEHRHTADELLDAQQHHEQREPQRLDPVDDEHDDRQHGEHRDRPGDECDCARIDGAEAFDDPRGVLRADRAADPVGQDQRGEHEHDVAQRAQGVRAFALDVGERDVRFGDCGVGVLRHDVELHIRAGGGLFGGGARLVAHRRLLIEHA